MDKEKAILLKLLSDMEDEVRHNRGGLRGFSECAIRFLKEEINRRWPGEIKEDS